MSLPHPLSSFTSLSPSPMHPWAPTHQTTSPTVSGHHWSLRPLHMLIFLPGVALLSPLADPSSSMLSLKITFLLLFSPLLAQ